MRKHKYGLLAATLFAAAFLPSLPALADAVLVKRVAQEQSMNLPSRGLSMAQVERRYGAPTAKLGARGGGQPRQPVINRWQYPTFIVFFEHDRVIHSVLNTPAGNNLNPAVAH